MDSSSAPNWSSSGLYATQRHNTPASQPPPLLTHSTGTIPLNSIPTSSVSGTNGAIRNVTTLPRFYTVPPPPSRDTVSDAIVSETPHGTYIPYSLSSTSLTPYSTAQGNHNGGTLSYMQPPVVPTTDTNRHASSHPPSTLADTPIHELPLSSKEPLSISHGISSKTPTSFMGSPAHPAAAFPVQAAFNYPSTIGINRSLANSAASANTVDTQNTNSLMYPRKPHESTFSGPRLINFNIVAFNIMNMPLDQILSILQRFFDANELSHKISVVVMVISEFKSKKRAFSNLAAVIQKEIGPLHFEELCKQFEFVDIGNYATAAPEERNNTSTFGFTTATTDAQIASSDLRLKSESSSDPASRIQKLYQGVTYDEVFAQPGNSINFSKPLITAASQQHSALTKGKSAASRNTFRVKRLKTSDSKPSPISIEGSTYNASPSDLTTPTPDTRENREGMSIYWCLPDEKRCTLAYSTCPEVRELVSKKKLTREYLRVDALVDRADFLASLRLQADKRNVLNFLALDTQNFQGNALTPFKPSISNERSVTDALKDINCQLLKPEALLKHLLDIKPTLFWRGPSNEKPAGALFIDNAVLEQARLIVVERAKVLFKYIVSIAKNRRHGDIQKKEEDMVHTSGTIRSTKEMGSGKSVPLPFDRLNSIETLLPSSNPADCSLPYTSSSHLTHSINDRNKGLTLTLEDLRVCVQRKLFPYCPLYHQAFIDSLLVRYS